MSSPVYHTLFLHSMRGILIPHSQSTHMNEPPTPFYVLLFKDVGKYRDSQKRMKLFMRSPRTCFNGPGILLNHITRSRSIYSNCSCSLIWQRFIHYLLPLSNKLSVTILLLSRYATGNDCRLLGKQVSFSCTKGSGDTISSNSTELGCLSLSDPPKNTILSDCKMSRLSC